MGAEVLLTYEEQSRWYLPVEHYGTCVELFCKIKHYIDQMTSRLSFLVLYAAAVGTAVLLLCSSQDS
jgi:hypothetical protein